MILDSSPLVAILAEEPDAELYIQAISRAPRCRISAGNFIELSIVIESQFGVEVAQQCDALFRRIGIVIEPVTVEQGASRAPGLPRLRQGPPRGRAEFR